MATELPKPIVLIGMTGAGKSSVGQALARALERCYQDSDELMSAAENKPLRDIMLDHGEPYFREIEERANLKALGDGNRLVLATGGGAATIPALRHAFRTHSFCIWLKATPPTLMRRLGARPFLPVLLQGNNPEEKLVNLLNERSEFYAAASHLQIDTDTDTIEDTVTMIRSLLP